MKNKTVTLDRELMPCPFCGKDAKLEVEDVRGDNAWCFIRCSYRCKVAPHVGEHACIWYWSEGKKHRMQSDDEAKAKAREYAVKAWNTRAALAEPVPPAVVATGMPYNQAVAVWFSAATKGAPVPPAGGNRLPERPYASEDDQSTMTDYEIGFGHGGCEMWDKFQPHITRLQAEVELLKLDLRLSEQTKQKFIEANETFGNLAFEKMTLKAELTKARERVYELEHAIFHALDDSIEYEALIDEVAITKLDFEKLNALLPEDWEHRQSAPAAKDENKS